MSQFNNSLFRDGDKETRRLIRDVQRATLPPTVGGSAGTRPAGGAAAMGSSEITQHADGENIQVAFYDLDPYDDEHYLYG